MSVIWKNKYASLSEPKALFTVLIAAAGSGQRLGGVYKPLLPLDGMPMIAYSFRAFEQNGFVRQIVVSAPPERAEEIRAVAADSGCTKLKDVVPGGETRAQSVIAAFRAAFSRKEDVTPFLAVHDAARPLIEENMLNDVFFACVRHGAAVAATKVRDALKRTGHDNTVAEEVNREGLWQIQTPQAFDTDIFHTALATTSPEEAARAVDDAALVLGSGFRVVCVETGFANFKVTYPEDVPMAQALLRARKESRS
ncbi:MAG: 2-C-methyl-D-erythritol 4-phosphate cytidylyltransferase [Eubacteriales bacterium]